MTIVLDHTIVPVADKRRSARLLSALIGTEPGAPVGPFIPVAVNDQLMLDFDERFGARPSHYWFHVDDRVFDRAVEQPGRRRAGLDPPAAHEALRIT